MDLTITPRHGEVQNVLRDMLAAYSHIQDAAKEVEGWTQRRLESTTHHAHTIIREGLETGSQPLTSVGLLGLISDCHAIREREDGLLGERLEPYLEALRTLIDHATRVLGLEESPLPKPDDYASTAARKRRRTLIDKVGSDCKQDTRTGVLQMIHNSHTMQPSSISAAEHRLLCTVIPESALLPDISAMHDFYHPNIALYSDEEDTNWTGDGIVHLGFHTTTMLHEFVAHRAHMRRFTFVHLMYRMGFGSADINFFVTYVDDTFYRRIVCDARIGFLAESFSPRIRVYHGQQWANLWDCFLTNRHRSDNIHWTKITRARMAAEAVIKEVMDCDQQQLVPSTVLGALHRQHGTRMVPYNAWAVMDQLVELEAEFLEGIQSLQRGELQSTLDSVKTIATAWPVCPRRVAVLHICLLVHSLSLLPRSPQLIQSAMGKGTVDVQTAAQWLWSLVPRADEECPDPGHSTSQMWGSSASMLLHKLREHMCAPATAPSLMHVCEEVSEHALKEATTYRYWEVTDADKQKMATHLHNLASLLHAANTHSPAHWPERKRRVYGYSPSEVFATIQQEAEVFSPTEHESIVAQRLGQAVCFQTGCTQQPGFKQVIDDPIVGDLGHESAIGESQLRPRAVYPIP